MADKLYGRDRADAQNGMAQRQTADSKKWSDMLSMLNAAQKNDWQTMLGFGLGRLMRNYYQRGMDKKSQQEKQRAYEELYAKQHGGEMPYYETPEETQARYDDTLANGYGDMVATSKMPSSMEMTGGQRGKGVDALPPGSAKPDVERTVVVTENIPSDTMMDGLLEGLPKVNIDWQNANDLSALEKFSGVPFNPNYRNAYQNLLNWR